MTNLTDKLVELRGEVAAAEGGRSEAKHRADRQRSDAGRDVTADLVKLRDDIAFKRPDAPPEADRLEHARRLTRELFEAVEAQGLIVEPVPTPNGYGLSVVDPSIDAEYDEANRALIAARAALRTYEQENRAELRAEGDRCEADRIREAISGDDPDAIRRAINGESDGSAALTSADVAPTRQRVTQAN